MNHRDSWIEEHVGEGEGKKDGNVGRKKFSINIQKYYLITYFSYEKSVYTLDDPK